MNMPHVPSNNCIQSSHPHTINYLNYNNLLTTAVKVIGEMNRTDGDLFMNNAGF
jgi:hypothetical protein